MGGNPTEYYTYKRYFKFNFWKIHIIMEGKDEEDRRKMLSFRMDTSSVTSRRIIKIRLKCLM